MIAQWDAQGRVVMVSWPAKTNAERQAAFRERNPDYYKLIQRRRRAAVKALAAKLDAERAKVVRREPLMLPAPVERIEIPGRNAIPAVEAVEAVEAVRVALSRNGHE